MYALKTPFNGKGKYMASIFYRLFGRKTEPVKVEEDRSLLGGGMGLGYNSISSYSNSQAMRLSAVYGCVNIISNSIALLDAKVIKDLDGKKIEVKDHPLNQILNLKPNDKYNHFNFVKLLFESLILRGNGYAYIERDEKLRVKALHLIDPDFVQPMPQDDGTVKYLVAGMKSAVDSYNMIHLFLHVDNMMRGISVLKYADMALTGAFDAEKHSDQFFKSGAGLLGVLKASAPLTNEQKRQVLESWRMSMNNVAGGGVAVIPQGLDFQSISVSPEDAQLLDARKYSTIQICQFFGVSPWKIFDYSHTSYNSLEQADLSFIQDTIMPYVRLFEDELSRKCFLPSEIGEVYVNYDFEVLLSADKKTEAEYFKTLLVNGVLTINDVRSKLGYTPIEEDFANENWFQISYATAKSIANGDYIKGREQDQNQKVDNDVTGKAE